VLLLLLACSCRYFPAQQLSRPELGCEVVDEATFRLVPQPGGEQGWQCSADGATATQQQRLQRQQQQQQQQQQRLNDM
jgi:hypothetical protein